MKVTIQNTMVESTWHALKAHTKARIAIGRCGSSIPTSELLAFKLSHAKAIDAVHVGFQKADVVANLKKISNNEVLSLHSKAMSRAEYLQRPDLGRTLSDSSTREIKLLSKLDAYDISIVVADGLSTLAIEQNIMPLFQELLPALKSKYTLAPICVVEQARVAIADSISELFNARMAIIFIGERPGLMSPDSLGIYMTYEAKMGTTDERRNCISNVRQDGMSYKSASSKLMYLIDESFQRKLSGVNLKDEQDTQVLGNEMLVRPEIA